MENNVTRDNEKALLDAIVNNRYVGMTIINKDGVILFRNKISEEISGVANINVLNKHFSCIPGKGELLEVLKTEVPELGYIYKTKTGANAVIHRLPLINKDNCVIGAMSIVIIKDPLEMQDILYNYNLVQSKLKYYEKEFRKLQSAKYDLQNIIGISEKITYLKNTITKFAKTKSPILITGETGTGKELCAHAIHLRSGRQNGSFIKVNCASIPHYLFESELFGYEPGAFTNADKNGKPGKFELANHGTIFLDEISSLPLEMQPKLLRVLQEAEVERIGGNKIIGLDFRLISSTNKDLDLLVKENKFREDLYYRINVLNIDVPPLRERKEDIPPLCEHFIKTFNEEFGLRILEIDKRVMGILHEWHWPGNVRELGNVLERAVNIAEAGSIKIRSLPDYLVDHPKVKYNGSENFHSNNLLRNSKNKFERKLLESTLLELNGNKSRVSNQLGISRPHLYALIKKYGLQGISRNCKSKTEG